MSLTLDTLKKKIREKITGKLNNILEPTASTFDFQFSYRWVVVGLGADTVCQANPAHSDTRGEASQTDKKETQIENSNLLFLSVTKIA